MTDNTTNPDPNLDPRGGNFVRVFQRTWKPKSLLMQIKTINPISNDLFKLEDSDAYRIIVLESHYPGPTRVQRSEYPMWRRFLAKMCINIIYSIFNLVYTKHIY